jgi:GT2 family glycosyltransferase
VPSESREKSLSQEPHPDAPASVAFQSVLYQASLSSLERAVEALDNSARIGKRDLACSRFEVILGDASPKPVLDDATLSRWRATYVNLDVLEYVFFDENTGTSRGHNALAHRSETEFVVLANPDVVVDALAIWRMVAVFSDSTVGMVEAKQLPVEHPKDYDLGTGRTSWASGAFSMIRRELFRELDGYDADSFFMYCDDVDLSWRVRETGRTIVFHPSAVVFHDKRLTVDGAWQPTAAEHYYSAQAALLLRHKWSREDLVDKVLKVYDKSELDEHRDAAEEFRRRREAGELVAQHDPDHVVGEFVEYQYAEHRYAL